MAEETKPTPNRILRTERERRAWSQSQLADEVGTTPLNISRWERGITQPGPHFRRKLCDLFDKTPHQLGFVGDHDEQTAALASALPPPTEHVSQEGEPSTLWNVAYGRNSFFTGREDILAQLRDALVSSSTGSVALAQPQAISGLGGIGKTQTAVEYAYRFREHYQAVFWARADSYDLLATDFLTIASLLALPQRNEQEQDKIIQAVVRWLDTHSGWLLILDNADDLDLVRTFTPTAGKGHVILTTRAQALGTMAQRIEIEKMGTTEGTLFLLRRIKRSKADAAPATHTDLYRQAQAIVEAVDGLPLAIDQAGAYIEETHCSVADYLKFYKTRRSRLLRARGKDATGHPEPVATTWALSFEKVEQANPAAAELLKLCAFLHPDSIPERMISEGASELGPILGPIVADEFDLNEAIGELHKYSLIKRDSEEKVLNIHRLVQVVIKDGMKEDIQKEWMGKAIQVINRIFPDPEKVENWPVCQQYLPHAQVCEEFAKQHSMTSIEVAQLLQQMGMYSCYRGQYSASLPLLQRSLTMREQVLGLHHLDVAVALNNLGLLYWKQGKYEQSEQLFQRTINIREKVLGKNNLSVAKALGNIAVLHMIRSQYALAETSFLQVIDIFEQSLGPNHLTLTTALINLGAVYGNWGKYAQAEPIFRRVLSIRESALGPNHPNVARSLYNLAKVYRDMGQYEQVEPLHLRALAIQEEVLGPEHPDVSQGLNDLAVLYVIQGRYLQAEAHFLRALAIREKILGSNHAELAETRNDLAKMYTLQERYDIAEPLFQSALTIGEQALGADHPFVADILQNYAQLLHKTNRADEAALLAVRAQAIREKQQ